MVSMRSTRVAVAAAVSALSLAALPAAAIPRLDLSAYPQPAAGERRWVIQLPGVLPPSRDPALSPDPRQWRVQLIVGQMAEVDCNATSFSARLRAWQPAASAIKALELRWRLWKAERDSREALML